jgi:hypothetical protein
MHPELFRAEHFRRMQAQAAQPTGYVTDAELKALEGELAFTLMHEGEPIACTGAVKIWNNRAYVWALLSEKIDKRIFRQVHTFAKIFVDNLPFRRVEATVEAGFDEGHRWVKSLGFVCETPQSMKAFQANGRDGFLYARVREK